MRGTPRRASAPLRGLSIPGASRCSWELEGHLPADPGPQGTLCFLRAVKGRGGGQVVSEALAAQAGPPLRIRPWEEHLPAAAAACKHSRVNVQAWGPPRAEGAERQRGVHSSSPSSGQETRGPCLTLSGPDVSGSPWASSCPSKALPCPVSLTRTWTGSGLSEGPAPTCLPLKLRGTGLCCRPLPALPGL